MEMVDVDVVCVGVGTMSVPFSVSGRSMSPPSWRLSRKNGVVASRSWLIILLSSLFGTSCM